MPEVIPQLYGYLLIALFAIVFIPLGYISRRKASGAMDFLVAREAFSAPIAIVSLIATWTWTSSILGSAEGAYQFGAAGFWVYGFVVPLSAIVLGVPIITRVRRRTPNASSFPEYIRLRFPDDWRGTSSHLIFAIIAGGQMFLWAVLQVIGVGVVIHALFDIPQWQSALAMGLIVTAYITFGGLRASIRTDFIQMLAIGVLLATILPLVIILFGGPDAIYEGLASAEISKATHMFTEDVLYGWLLVSLFSFINYAIINQNVWQRIFAAERGSEGYIVTGSAIAWLPIPGAAGVIGMIGIAIGFDGPPSAVMPTVIGETLPTVAAFGFAVLIVAVVVSTIDSCLNSFASIVITDIYKPYIGNEEKAQSDQSVLRNTKILLVITGLLAAAIGTADVSVLFFNYAVGALAIPITWPFVLSVVSPRFNYMWGIVGMLLGIVAALLFVFLPSAGLWESPFPLWQGYLISHVVALLIPLVGTAISPNEEFSFEQITDDSSVTTGGDD
jgi:Na+/proline symporter